VALWTFDEDGQTINDASSFKCNATLGRTPEPDPSDPARVPAYTAPAVSASAASAARLPGNRNPLESGGPVSHKR